MLKERAEISKTIRALAGLHKFQVKFGTGKTEVPGSKSVGILLPNWDRKNQALVARIQLAGLPHSFLKLLKEERRGGLLNV